MTMMMALAAIACIIIVANVDICVVFASGSMVETLLPEYIMPHAVHLLAHQLPAHDSLPHLSEAKL